MRIGVVEQVVGAVLLFAILFLVVALVAQRYLPGVNFPQTGEVARLSMVWLTFLMCWLPRGPRPPHRDPRRRLRPW